MSPWLGIRAIFPTLSTNIKLLHCIVLYCIVLHCIVLHCTVFYCIVLHCIVLYYTCIVLYCITLCYIVLYCIALHTLHYIVYCIALHCITLFCIALHCIVLYIQKRYTAVDIMFPQQSWTICFGWWCPITLPTCSFCCTPGICYRSYSVLDIYKWFARICLINCPSIRRRHTHVSDNTQWRSMYLWKLWEQVSSMELNPELNPD